MFFFLSLLITSVTLFGQQAPPPAKSWQTLESARFQVIFDQNSQDLAEESLIALERAFTELSKHWRPPNRKIPVVLRLETDLPNGYATILPYPHIVLFPVAPGFQESIGEYHDWLYELALHELIHIFTFEQRRGLAKNLWYIFGNILTPNILLPRWWLEGVAVDGESRYSLGGRVRSAYQDAVIRSQVLDQALDSVTLPAINEFRIPSWPYGHRPYLYGSILWSELVLQSGESASGEIHHLTGGRLPYLLNSPMQKTSGGLSAEELFHASKKRVTQKAEQQVKQLQMQAPSSLHILKSSKWVEAHAPSLSPDGHTLVFIARRPNLSKAILKIERPHLDRPFEATNAKELFSDKEELTSYGLESPLPLPEGPIAHTIGRISWLPDSSGFIYDLTSPTDRYHTRSDLWKFDLKSQKTHRLSKGLRAREPSVSPDGSQVAYVKLGSLSNAIEVYDLALKKNQTWFAKKKAFASWPIWVNQKTLLATIKTLDGEHLTLIRPGFEQRLPLPCPRARFANSIGPDKIHVTCDLNGVWNVYEVSNLNALEPKIVPVTHLLTSAWTHAWDPHLDSLWLTTLDSKGFQIAFFEITPGLEPKSPLPKVSPLYSFTNELTKPPLLSQIEYNTQDYRASSYLWPQYWIPFIYTSDKSSAFLISTGGHDPLFKHQYQLSLMWDQVVSATNYNFSYLNQVTHWPFQVLALKETSYLSDPQLKTQIELFGAAVELPTHEDPKRKTALMITKQNRTFLGSRSEQTQLSLRHNYSNTQSNPRHATPHQGKAYAAEVTHIQQALEPKQILNAKASWQLYHQGPFEWNHANKWKVSGYFLDQQRATTNFISTQSWEIGNSGADFLMRGYTTGAFFAPKAVLLNYEHWFPSWRVDKGSTWAASYFHQVHFGLVTDHIAVDGFAYQNSAKNYIRVNTHDIFSSVGAETLFDFNVGYHFDIKLVLGYYLTLASKLGPPETAWNLGLRF